LTELDITGANIGTSYFNFYCYNNASLTSFTATNCQTRSGYDFALYDNPVLTEIDLTGSSIGFEIYNCASMTSLDVSSYSTVRDLDVHDMPITSLDLSGCTALGDVTVRNCANLTSLDLSGLQSLNYVYINGNASLTDLNLDNIKTLRSVNVYNNNALTELDITGANIGTSYFNFYCYNNASLTSFTATNCQTRSGYDFVLHDNPVLTQVDFSNNPSLRSIEVSRNAVETLSVAGCSSLNRLTCEEDALETLYISDASAFELRLVKTDAWNSLTVRDASGDEIATSSNNTYFYFNPGSYDSNPITMEFYASGATEPNRTATIITKDFETSQSGSFTGAVDVSWARPWGDFKDCSTRLTWSTATSSTVLNSGASEGSCTFDASQLPDGPGVLTLEYVDALGNVVGTVSVDAIVLNAGALVVDTADDTVNAYDSKTSLLEAVAYAEAFGIEAPITFAPGLAGQTVRVNGALRLSSAHIDAGATGVAIRADSVVVSGDSSIANTRLITNALTVSAPLAMTGATLEFTGDSAAVNATAALTAENLTVAGADSTWRVTNVSRFINPTFNSDAAFTNGSVLTLEGALTANGNVLLSNASISTSGNAAIAGTGAVSFSGNSNDAINVAGTEDAPATLTVAPGATLQGAGKITGQYLTTVVSGTFVPAGNFAVAGEFELAVDGSLIFGVASLTDYPRLSISGPATVRGEVVLERLNNGFVPTSQNTFAVLQASALDVLPSATFDTETMNALAQIAEEISNDSLVFTVGWVSGPKVVSVTPLDNYSTGASKTYFDVYFNQPIDASSFTASDVAVRTSQGASVAVENP
ncbi:MAG: hypothetical protein II807_09855, partial [Thermoguttaceae bacterium]|nr:hypothetical protein [Thermoguttaceae bacterium]